MNSRTAHLSSHRVKSSHWFTVEGAYMAVLCGKSAWEYWSTPPLVADAALTNEDMAQCSAQGGGDARLASVRVNACETVRKVHGRLRTDLKNLSLPVCVSADNSSSFRDSALIAPHAFSQVALKQHALSLGGGLFVASVPLALAQASRSWSFYELVLHMFEACGTYCVANFTDAASYTLDALRANGIVSPDMPGGVREYYDADGRRAVAVCDDFHDVPWVLSYDRFGKPTNLWRRPPLATVEELENFAVQVRRLRGIRMFRQAVGCVLNGSASPLESRLVMLLCLEPRLGGQGWPRPYLNRRIDYAPAARLLAERSYAIADLMWPDQRVCIEVNGEDYHADREGFTLQSGRRAALEAMGYTMFEINYDQMCDLSCFEAMLETFCARLGFTLQPLTRMFQIERSRLHRALFP